jgi:CRISPR/Cas system CSM-associated protein Csm3 (group 7 of RAMP superfamily)
VGGEPAADSTADLQVSVDSLGRCHIPGSSIAGSARNYLARKLQSREDYQSRDAARWREPDALHALMGDDFESLLSVFDAREITQSTPTLRDGIEVCAIDGIAADERKFLSEVLPAGSKFEFRFWLRLFDTNPFNTSEADLLQLLRTMLDGFSVENGIRIGKRVRKGWGRGVADWKIYCFEMPEHLDAWLDNDFSKARLLVPDDLGEPLLTDRRRVFRIEAAFSAKASVLIRRESEVLDQPDFVHISENGIYPLPGTSVGGALRSRIEMIANTRLLNADALINGMLGPRYERAIKTRLTAGRLTVEESRLEGGSARVQGRNTIDRFSGATLDTALFHEAAWWPNRSDEVHWKLVVRLELPEDKETADLESALLFMAFRDLWLGDLAVGGESGSGRGVFLGCWARLEHPDAGEIVLNRDPRIPQERVQAAPAVVRQWETIAAALCRRELAEELK